MSHSYQTYFGFPELDLNLDCELRDHVITRFASNDQIKLKSEHEVMGRENQDEEQTNIRPTLKQIRLEPKTPLQPIQPPIQTQTNIRPTLKQIRPFNHYSKTLKSGQDWG